MSDRVAGAPSLEVRMDDVRAVMDAAASERAAIMGVSECGPLGILYAAMHPDRAWALVVEGGFARTLWAPDYPWGATEDDYDREAADDEREWGSPEAMAAVVEFLASSLGEEDKRALGTMIRLGASPGAVAALGRMNRDIDVRGVLSAVRVPTLVMNRASESPHIVRGSRYLAQHIAGARHVELPGVDHAVFASHPELAMAETRRFLEDTWKDRAWEEEPDRVLATVLFTDIVGSTAKAIEVGDRRWRELVQRHHALIRRQLVRFRGTELDTAGDGFFASFDGPARAIRCACAITEGVRELGLEVRAGLHAGECEVIEGKVGGVAVHIGARVAGQAGPGEVVVSSTVRDLVVGSGIAFADRGEVELKSVPGAWRLSTVDPASVA
jgi:class 3 adenylate cyclase/pimeloyl-ACP methyl ester carboxylesterase